jgi:hypothetical protein
LVETATRPSVLPATQSAIDGQDTSTKLPPAWVLSSHTGATAVGFTVRARWPALSTAMQSVSAGQATAVTAFVPSIWVAALQDADEPPGVVERVAPPTPELVSTSHSVAVGHEIAPAWLPLVGRLPFWTQVDADGLVETVSVPPSPTATHSAAERHETAFSRLPPA